MLTIRLITAGAVLVMAVGAAAAQSTDTAGRPFSLFQVLSPPPATTETTTTTTTTETTTTALSPHARVAHKRVVRHWAKKSHEHDSAEQTETTEPKPPEQTGQDAAAASEVAAPPAASVWTDGGATPLPGVATNATAPTVIPAVDQNLSAVVVGGHTVQVATPDEFNAIDLAASHEPALQAAADTSTAPAASPSAAALAQPDGHARDVWYEELLATLGGALAAGVVAWFLVAGGSHQRMYG